MPAAQLQKVGGLAAEKIDRRPCQSLLSVGSAERASIVQEGHRDQESAEDTASHPEQRQDGNRLPRFFFSGEILGLVSEGILDDVAPAPKMTVGPVGLLRNEPVPILGRSRVAPNSQLRTGRATLLAVYVDTGLGRGLAVSEARACEPA